LTQLTFFDYVVGITIGSIAASLSVDQNIKILNGIVGLLVWGMLPILISYLNLKSYIFRQMTDGHATVVVQNGMILEKNLKKLRLTSDELMMLLREKNAFKLSEVEFAILETNGSLSVMKKSDSQPVTPKLLNLPVEMEHDPRIVIMDGKVMEKTLMEMGYNKEWLLGEIKKQGASDFEDVYLAQLTSNGNLYVDLKNDQLYLAPVSQKVLVKATLQKSLADLQSYALETNNPEAKKMYQEHAKRLEGILHSLEPYLNG
jgi:uncharacterized membrane protein YcaP (DUF421 family)